LAKAFGSELVLVRVLEPAGNGHGEMPAVPVGWHIGQAEVEGYLTERARRLAEVGTVAKTRLLHGEPAESITRYVRTNDVDLVVLSTHGAGGLSRWNVSSVARKVALGARTAVMIVRAYLVHQEELDGLSYRRLLVPVSGSPRAEAALPWASSLADSCSAEVVVVGAVERPALVRRGPVDPEDAQLAGRLTERSRDQAANYLRNLVRRSAAKPRTRIVESSDLYESLSEVVEQEGADLVVLSAHAFSPTCRWPYDRVCRDFISHGACNLLVIQDLEADAIRQTPAQVAARQIGDTLRTPLRAGGG
jgi:nucleotide-binding universal stress UspA family protein